MLKGKKGIGDYCSECGMTERGGYSCPPDRTFTCSRCVIVMLSKKEKDDEEKAKKEKEAQKKKQEALANRPVRRNKGYGKKRGKTKSSMDTN